MRCEPDPAQLVHARIAWAHVRASFRQRGYSVDRLTAGAGYRISRGVWSLDVPDMRGVAEFAARAGICL